MFWLFGPEACGILAPRQRTEHTLPALEGEALMTGPRGSPHVVISDGSLCLTHLYLPAAGEWLHRPPLTTTLSLCLGIKPSTYYNPASLAPWAWLLEPGLQSSARSFPITHPPSTLSWASAPLWPSLLPTLLLPAPSQQNREAKTNQNSGQTELAI